MDQIALGKRIKAARERAGMTQDDLAAAVDYSVDHMSVVERGVKAPKLDKLTAIANVLGVGTDELLQDSLIAATMLQATVLSERLKSLPPETQLWGDRIFEKCGIRRDEGGDGGKTLEIRGKRRLSARDGGANYQQS